MAMSIGQKATRVMRLLLGLREPRVARTMASFGFDEAELQRGWALLQGLTNGRLAYTGPAQDPSVLANIDAFENRWFPIAEVVLRVRYPEAHARVFANLAQSSGPEVVVTVTTLLDRLQAITKPEAEGGLGEEGVAARDILAQRGLDAAELARGRSLLARLGTFDEEDARPPVSPEEAQAAEDALWDYYLEWSRIARVGIHDGRLLRLLGFRQGGPRDDAGDDVDADDPSLDRPSLDEPSLDELSLDELSLDEPDASDDPAPDAPIPAVV